MFATPSKLSDFASAPCVIASAKSAAPEPDAGRLQIRPAMPDETGVLAYLQTASLGCKLLAAYPQAILRGWLGGVDRFDPVLLDDGRYFVATADGMIAGGAGWSAPAPDYMRRIVSNRRPLSSWLSRDAAVMTAAFFVDDRFAAALVGKVAEQASRFGHKALETFIPPREARAFRAAGFAGIRVLEIGFGELAMDLLQVRFDAAGRGRTR